MRPPSVDALARSLADIDLPHPLLVDAARAAIAAGDPGTARSRAESTRRALLGPVVNATGILLHTNLGRAPWPVRDEGGYRNLELDLATGERGSRDTHAAGLLARLCGADDALVVNNGAAAVLLVLRTLAAGLSVVVSRGELVEIGGGFRIPEILAESGAHLVEVGTTNRTRLADYEAAIASADPPVGLVLKVHPSNYRITGFTSSVPVSQLVGLGVPVVVDVGSGLLDATCPWLRGGPPEWLRDEPACRQTLAAGAALITFSGDKLLGGPQAGVVAGSAAMVARCRRQPLARAVRPGGHVLGAVQQLALAYLRNDGDAIPLWRMASVPVEVLRQRAQAIVASVGDPAIVVDTDATMGGGSAPGTVVPSVGVAVPGSVAAELRSAPTPVLARVVDDHTVADLRTVDPSHDDLLAAALKAAVLQ
ncbi:MAG: L-seryl-tRNA(Sec) selenium transferase [Acidobacteria bacterium]|nr:L-seryl-tRNA(Sec) selenium transferase [Acidobacteriota bacterium]